MVITIYPLIYTFSMSVSNPIYVANNSILFLPKGFSLQSYSMLLQDKNIWKGYYNTIWYTVVGTFISVAMTVLAAYPLSRKRYILIKPLMIFIVLTMFFSGGMIPSFILINQLGLYNTRWAIVIPAAISTWNLIICRSFFKSIPDSFAEAAEIDGASQLTILLKIFLPLSMPVVAVLILFYAVGQWNSYFPATLYLTDSDLMPLQIYLRRVVIHSSSESVTGIAGGLQKSLATMQLKYSIIIVTILPILCVYPFLQKYFIKGVMIGGIKG